MRAILFDLDGTLAETEDLKFLGYCRCFRNLYGVTLPSDDIWRGRPEAVNVQYFLDLFGLDGDIQMLIQAKREEYRRILRTEGVPPNPGLRELLTRAAAWGYARGVVTSSERESTELVLTTLDLHDCFDAVVTVDDVTLAKPNAEPYLMCARRVAVTPEECLAIEDSPTGMASAKAAGMKCIAYRPRVTLPPGLADRVVGSFDEITREFIATLAGHTLAQDQG